MKVNWKWIVVLYGILLFGSGVLAQTNVPKLPINVIVPVKKDAESQLVAGLVSVKVLSTPRYSLGPPATGDLGIVLDIICLPDEMGGRKVGVVCDLNIGYLPPDRFWPSDRPISANPYGGIMASGTPRYVVEYLFNAFVEQTTDAMLKLDADSLELFRVFVCLKSKAYMLHPEELPYNQPTPKSKPSSERKGNAVISK